MNVRPLAAAVIVAVSFSQSPCVAPAFAQDSLAQSAAASRASLAASGMIVAGSAELIRAGALLVVASVTPIANASVIVLRDVATGLETSVRVASRAAGTASVAVGESVRVVAEAAGCSLVAGGRLIAFVPNEVGRALIYQSHSTQTVRNVELRS